MKRAVILGLGVLFVTAAIASAQNPPSQPAPTSSTPTVGANFVDADGDGICDNFQAGKRGPNGGGRGQGQGMGKGFGRGQGNGTHVGPQDGTGFGARAGAGAGTGICDGTGPKGRGRRK